MPYKVKKQDGKHCVVKEGGAQVACHDTRAKALAQVRALYANEKAEIAAAHSNAKEVGPRISCLEDDCARAFLDFDKMLEHTTRVHSEEAREFKAAERKKAAGKRQAMSDGSFPIKSVQDLKNAIQAYGRAKNKAAAKAHIIRRAKALKATNLLPKGWLGDSAGIECPADDCSRHFQDEMGLVEHAEAVHTFSDTERLVSEAVREKYGRRGDYKATPPVSSIYVWVNDMAADWVVFTVEGGDTQINETLYKASYSIVDGVVNLGEPVEVKRRTVYEPVKKEEES